MRNLGWANAGIGLVVQWYHSKVSMFIFVVIRWLLQILPLYPLSRQEVGKKTTNGELVVLLAKSVILLREFSRGFQTFFFFFLHLVGQTCVKQLSLSQGRLGNILVWFIALPTKSGSAIKKERMGTG